MTHQRRHHPGVVDGSQRAVADVTTIARRLIDSLETTAPPKDREAENAKARARNLIRFPRS